jgi:deoxyribodipyrimidine photo-lyase
MTQESAIVWFTNDLRLTDNLTLYNASMNSNNIYPVYCYNKNYYEGLQFGMSKTSAFKKQFLFESLQDLSENIYKNGNKLYYSEGTPEEIIVELALRFKVKIVFVSKQYALHEIQMLNATETALSLHKINLL